MKKVNFIFVILVLFCSMNFLYSQDYVETCFYTFVFTGDGSKLNYRDKPQTGKKIGQFEDGTALKATKITKEEVTIDNKSHYWYFVESVAEPQKRGWVFGGYISNEDVEFMLIGEWDNPEMTLSVCNNGDIRLGHKESEGLGGTWKVDDYIYLVFQDAYVYEPEDATTFSWTITSLTWNQVTFKNGDYTFTFTKINDER